MAVVSPLHNPALLKMLLNQAFFPQILGSVAEPSGYSSGSVPEPLKVRIEWTRYHTHVATHQPASLGSVSRTGLENNHMRLEFYKSVTFGFSQVLDAASEDICVSLVSFLCDFLQEFPVCLSQSLLSSASSHHMGNSCIQRAKVTSTCYLCTSKVTCSPIITPLPSCLREQSPPHLSPTRVPYPSPP